MKKSNRPLLVAIVGGSGSGKTRLADELQAALGKKAGRLSLDDFYLDRSHLSPVQRSKINFDHPRSMDWAAFERVIKGYSNGRESKAPRYDFNTHCRLSASAIVRPKAILLVDGLWLLRNPRIRRYFSLGIFVECPLRMRLQRRLARDVTGRGRSVKSVRAQFQKTVEPMHRKFVAPQIRWADIKLGPDWDNEDVEHFARLIESAIDKESQKQPTSETCSERRIAIPFFE